MSRSGGGGSCARQLLAAVVLAVVARAAGAGGPAAGATPSGAFALDARLPPFPTREPDEYLCTSLELPGRALKLTGVEALAKKEIVHHILLYGKWRWRRCGLVRKR